MALRSGPLETARRHCRAEGCSLTRTTAGFGCVAGAWRTTGTAGARPARAANSRRRAGATSTAVPQRFGTLLRL